MAKNLLLPLRVAANGTLGSVEHGSEPEVSQSVALLVATRVGERRSVPDYGLDDPVFGGVDADEIVDTVSAWEGRADPAFVEHLAESLINQTVGLYPAEQTEQQEAE